MLRGLPIADFDAGERELGPRLWEGLTTAGFAEVVPGFKAMPVCEANGITRYPGRTSLRSGFLPGRIMGMEGNEMTGKKRAAARSAAIAWLLLMALLCGCSRKEAETGPAGNTDPVVPTETAAPSEVRDDTGVPDGMRFEEIILLEGMEETVRYEHAGNENVGFELDYEYEVLQRCREAERERFVSRYDDPDDPWNYLEVTYRREDADSVAASVMASLSEDYDSVVTEPVTLDRAGECVRIDASGAKGGKTPVGSLESVYIIPAADGCRIAAAHYTVESAEGFGARFAAMLNTLSVMESVSPGAGSGPSAEGAKETLVVVFSATGTTKGVAEKLAAITDADLYEIIPVEPYTSDDLNYGDKNSRAAREHNDSTARPAIGSDRIDLAKYDTVFIGYPIWFGEEPRIMDAFAELYDFSGMTVIPFCTSGSSGIGSSGQNLSEIAGTGTWLEGKRFSGSTAENDLRAWIDGLG